MPLKWFAKKPLRPQITLPQPVSVNPSSKFNISASPTRPAAPPDRGLLRTFVVLTFAASGMAIFISLLPAVGHDQLWCLYVAQRILHGTKLYGPQLLESNPPLIMAMLLAPAALANILHLPVTLLFKLGVLCTEIVSALFSFQLLRRAGRAPRPTTLWSLAFAFITVFTVLPARDFGQRDHLLALLCLPYILSRTLAFGPVRLGGTPSAPDKRPATPGLSTWMYIAIGILAGLGICLKPHHALIPVMIETAVLFKHRSPRKCFCPEVLVLITVGAAFLFAIRIVTPAYLTEVVPLLRDVYWAIGHLTFPQLVAESVQLHVLAATTIGIFVLSKRRISTAPPLFLILAGIASTIAYYAQGTGWYYQQLPALSFFSLALWLLAAGTVPTFAIPFPQWTPKAALTLSVLALALTAHFSGYSLANPLSFPTGLSDIPDPTFFTHLPPGTPVAILSTVVDDTVPPIFTYHLLWAQRLNNLWTLPAILRNEDPQSNGHPQTPQHVIPPASLAELDRLQHQWMVEDLNRWHPTLILVLRCEDPSVQCQILEDRHDNLLAWFQRDPAFNAAFRRYKFLRSSGPYDAYTLREPAP